MTRPPISQNGSSTRLLVHTAFRQTPPPLARLPPSLPPPVHAPILLAPSPPLALAWTGGGRWRADKGRPLFPGQDYNFEKLKTDDVNSLGEEYDFALVSGSLTLSQNIRGAGCRSIMHYARDTFARAMYTDTILPKPDIVSLPPLDPLSVLTSPSSGQITRERPEIGQRVQLSDGDIRQANKLYNCPRNPNFPSSSFYGDKGCDAVCGGSLLDPSGQLSIGAGERGGVCQWRIVATKGESIFLNLTMLNMPKPHVCKHRSPLDCLHSKG